jgi:hypothetical protein
MIGHDGVLKEQGARSWADFNSEKRQYMILESAQDQDYCAIWNG